MCGVYYGHGMGVLWAWCGCPVGVVWVYCGCGVGRDTHKFVRLDQSGHYHSHYTCTDQEQSDSFACTYTSSYSNRYL